MGKDCSEPAQGKACYVCGKPGHLARNCTEDAQQDDNKSQDTNSKKADPATAKNISEKEKTNSSESSVPASASASTTTATSASVSTSTSTSNVELEPSKISAAPTSPAAHSFPKAPANAKTCYICGNSNHIAKFCRQAPRSRSYRSQSCYSCGQTGHLSKDCQQGQLCYNCGEHGHLSKECSEPIGKICYSCKQPGHISSQCAA